METWLLLTFLGAFLQNIRSFLQRRITDKLSINGSSFVRFLFAIPLAILLVLLLVDRIPSLSWAFLGYVIAGGVAANRYIFGQLQDNANAAGFQLSVPPAILCTDNAAMIAWAALERLEGPDTLDFAPRPRWPLDPNASPPPGRGVRQ